MKTVILAVFSSFLQYSIAAPSIEVPAKVAHEIELLLDSLPPQSILWRSHELTMNSTVDSDKSRLVAASEQVKAAHLTVPKVRRLLKIGTSILDYPGLLAHGDISYQSIGRGDPFASAKSSERGYRLYIGLPVNRTGHDFNFEIIFDSSGTIREINDVPGKE